MVHTEQVRMKTAIHQEKGKGPRQRDAQASLSLDHDRLTSSARGQAFGVHLPQKTQLFSPQDGALKNQRCNFSTTDMTVL
jgi:hypothetical protein